MSSDNGPKTSNRTRAISPNQLMMRRIIKNGDLFICGICRTKHSSHSHAAGCLVTCWKHLLERAPWVIEVRGIGKQPYACSYCQRGYSTAEQAHACAQDCLNKSNETSSVEVRSTKQKINRPFSKPSAKSTYQLAFQNQIARIKLADARVEAERLAVEQLKANPPKPEVTQSEKEPTLPQEKTEFLCDTCKKTYSTKEKADECLASHSNQGGSSQT